MSATRSATCFLRLRSRNGVTVTLKDTQGQESFVVETPRGQRMTLKDGPGNVEIVDSNGNTVKLETSGVTVEATAKVTIISSSMVNVKSPVVKVDAGMSVFNGNIKAHTVKCDSIIAASYTPGAGNIW